MRVKGLPIGQGELWHDPLLRALTFTLAWMAIAPAVGWALPALGQLSADQYQAWVEPPLLGFLAATCIFGAMRSRVLASRICVGIVVGLVGGLAYDMALAIARTLAPGVQFPLAGSGITGGVLDGAWAAHAAHWLGAAVAWTLAYAVVAGKARWYYGLAWSGLIWALVAAMTVLLPQGSQVCAPTSVALGALLGVHLAFGAVLGALNELLQPETRGQGKIIFLRDYMARVKER